MTDKLSRRHAFRVVGIGLIAGPPVLVACQQKKSNGTGDPRGEKKAGDSQGENQGEKAGGSTAKKTEEALNCEAGYDLSEQSKSMRQSLKYVENTPESNKRCNNCLQWIPAKETKWEGPCGGCKLFAGPVNPKGYCNSWVAEQSKTT